eukprot:s5802_g6.t1
MTAHRLRVRYTTGLCAGGGTEARLISNWRMFCAGSENLTGAKAPAAQWRCHAIGSRGGALKNAEHLLKEGDRH